MTAKSFTIRRKEGLDWPVEVIWRSCSILSVKVSEERITIHRGNTTLCSDTAPTSMHGSTFSFTSTGHNMTNFFIWDGIRALDYLCSRPDADTSRIAVTGASGVEEARQG